MAQKEAVQSEGYTYTVVFQPEPAGGYTVTVPALRGCITYGETLDEARANAIEALELYLEVLKAEDRPIPTETPEEPTQPFRERVSVTLKTA